MSELRYRPPEELVSRYNDAVAQLKNVESLDNSGKMLDGARILIHQALTGQPYTVRLAKARERVSEINILNKAYVADILPAYKDQAAAEARAAGNVINPV